MKLPLKLGAARKDSKNGGEFYVVKDAEGAWIGDIRAEHAPEIVVAMNTARPEALRSEIIDECIKSCNAEQLADAPDNEGDMGYRNAVVDCVNALRALKAFPSPPRQSEEPKGLPPYPLAHLPGCSWPACECTGRWSCKAREPQSREGEK